MHFIQEFNEMERVWIVSRTFADKSVENDGKLFDRGIFE